MSPRDRRQLRLFYAYRLLATSYLYVPIFMLFQAARGLTFFEQLALGAVYAGAILVAEVPTGVFADRFGRRRSMALGAVALVASALIAIPAHRFATFALAEALAAVSMALCSGADSAYLYDFLCERGRTCDYARCESIASAWHLVGNAAAFAGGGLLAQIDLALPYIATAGVGVAAALVAWLLHDDAPATARTAWRSEITGALVEVARNGRLAWMVGYSAVVFVLLRATIYVYQPYLEDRGLGPVAVGALFAGVNVVAAVVAARTAQLRKRFGDDTLLWALLAALAISFVGLAGATRGPWMLALLAVQAIANGIYSPLTKPLLNREIADSRQRAAILSVESMARRVAMGLFAPLAGVYGRTELMLLCGAIGLGGFVVLALARTRTRVVAERG